MGPSVASLGPRADSITILTGGVLSPTNNDDNPTVQPYLYDGIYRLDAHFEPLPDLAAEPCAVASDQVTITCHLREARFHDGTPLTADDVVFTYELLRSPSCSWGPGFDQCRGQGLASVRALDARTVEFVLHEPDATFFTALLPSVWIDARHVVEGAYQELAATAAGHDPDDLDSAANDVYDRVFRADPACATGLDALDALTVEVGIEPYDRGRFATGPGGSFDACAYALAQADRLQAVAASLRATGIDAIAASYPALSIQQHPIGTGPWRFAGFDGPSMELEAYPDDPSGEPATKHIEFRHYDALGDLVSAWRAGSLDVIRAADPDTLAALRGEPDTTMARFNDTSYFGLLFNTRPRRLFADVNLRRAVALCFDKAKTVEAATGGAGIAIESPVMPSSWAFDETLTAPERDVAAARRSIEASGWTMGEDGVYTNGGQRLSTAVPVRADKPDRVHFVQLLSAQVADCGIELTPAPAEWTDDGLIGMVNTYPHIIPGTGQPFDAYFAGWRIGPDPGEQFSTFHTSGITRAGQGYQEGVRSNITGFSDPNVDRLLEQGRATYDQRERARIYKDLQRVLADDLPYVFAYSGNRTDIIRSTLTSTAGPLAFDSPNWAWQRETLELSP